MFAPPVAKAQRAAASPTRKLAPQRSTLVARPSIGGAAEQAHMLQRSIGNQATLRLLSQRTRTLTENEPHGHNEQEADPTNLTARGARPGVSWDFSKIPLSPPGRAVLQRKLVVGTVDDPLECEADAVADRVMRMAAPVAPISAATVRLSRSCEACESNEREMIHRKRIDPDDEIHGKLIGPPPLITDGLEQRIRNLSAGDPLPASERAFFEPRFGHDFGSVRVHTDPDAAALARGLNARAFTIGPKIVFGPGEFSPGSAAGRRLVAHELAHVVQQRPITQNTVQRDLATPPPEPAPAAQRDLTQAQVDAAIRFNKFTYDEARTKQLQDLIGTDPTGIWAEEDILAVAALQEEYGLHKDGMIGPRTFEFLDRETRREGLPRTDENCLLAFNVGVDRPTVGPIAGGQRPITGHFTMRALFSQYCNCTDYVYRQLIRGHWRRIRGGVVTDLAGTFTNFPGGALPAAFTEDGNITTPALNYGHRDQANEGTNNGYFDDPAGATANQATGCHYVGDDTPGGPDNVMPGDVFDILVAFQGEIRRGGRVVETQFWSAINGRFPVP